MSSAPPTAAGCTPGLFAACNLLHTSDVCSVAREGRVDVYGCTISVQCSAEGAALGLAAIAAGILAFWWWTLPL